MWLQIAAGVVTFLFSSALTVLSLTYIPQHVSVLLGLVFLCSTSLWCWWSSWFTLGWVNPWPSQPAALTWIICRFQADKSGSTCEQQSWECPGHPKSLTHCWLGAPFSVMLLTSALLSLVAIIWIIFSNIIRGGARRSVMVGRTLRKGVKWEQE